MKWNVLYLFWLLAVLGLFLIYRQLTTWSLSHFFGSTEAEEMKLRSEVDAYIAEIRVKPGQQVRTGDTILLFRVPERDRKRSELNQLMQHTSKDEDLRVKILREEKSALIAEYRVKIRELQTRLDEIRASKAVHEAMKSSLVKTDPAGRPSLLDIEAAGIEEMIRELDAEKNKKLASLDHQISQRTESSFSSLQMSRTELDYLEDRQGQLCLRSQVDGFASELKLRTGDYIRSGSELMEIIPLRPSKVKGFLPESSGFDPASGTRVLLSSLARRSVSDTGTIRYVFPNITELPVRLRKIPELRSWGRELYISLDADNPFLIGEKLRIDLLF